MKHFSKYKKYNISLVFLGFISNIFMHLFYSFVRLEFASFGFSDFIKYSELTIHYYFSLALIFVGSILTFLDILDSNNKWKILG